MSSKPVLVSTRLTGAVPLSTTLPWATSASIFLGDLVALSSVYWLAVLGRRVVSPGYELSFYLDLFPCLMLLFGGFLSQDLYPGFLLHPAEEMRRVFYSVCVFFLLVMSTTFLWRNAEEYSRSVVLLTWAVSAPAILATRYLVRRALSPRPWWGIPAIVFGSGPSAQRVVRILRDRSLGVKITGVFTEDDILSWAHDLPPLLGSLHSASQFAQGHAAHYAIVAMPSKTSTELRHAIQDYCRGFQHVLLVPDLPGICSMGISARQIGNEIGLEVPQRLFHRASALAKRSVDLAACLLALLVICPVFAAIAIAIKLTSPGPVFFGHPRQGRNGKLFKAFKFRTMVPNGDEVLAAHLAANPAHMAEWQRDHKLKDDPRITSIGKWLRRYSLDELPQILNVVAGQMSLVGPRPIVAAEIPKYGRGYSLYTRVLPGITGLWQVSGRNNTTYEERVALDEYYVHNWSVWLDAYLLLRTVRTVLTADGAY